jgi:hypothetical protein
MNRRFRFSLLFLFVLTTTVGCLVAVGVLTWNAFEKDEPPYLAVSVMTAGLLLFLTSFAVAVIRRARRAPLSGRRPGGGHHLSAHVER